VEFYFYSLIRFHVVVLTWSRGSSVGLVTVLLAGIPGFDSRQGQRRGLFY
jgi:hypothetical protein